MDAPAPPGVGVRRAFPVLLAAGLTAPLAAQPSPAHLLLITGLGGQPVYTQSFHDAAARIYDVAQQWGVPDDNRVWLGEDPARDPRRITARATTEAVAAEFAALARRVRPGEVVLIVLIGHGSGQGPESRVNLPGPDPTARDYAGWLGPLDAATVVFVNASSASGDFLPALSGPNRIVITATRSSTERNESVFHTHFAHGLATAEADADKDGRITVLEAYTYARNAVRQTYESTNRLLTERAQLDDLGDGRGTEDPAATEGADGGLARQVAFGGAPASTDPRVVALMTERRELEARVTALRNRRATMNAEAYERELERLLLLIAEKTEAIRTLERERRP